ncbi:aminotransferase class I/II-fold pyridoxal phosphate-dependent enzyme [Catenulispora pinisilvae]|uniref:aminotransferase class I/II-fold pyridoxal phosphate-dependent enzyme n=1 Tax=Catenulispora pinisilvae TaxID=2705253 RepID=UPI00189102BA|nr:aminotransferase class I/II-fold pyridoxal phosphate-dependent enzyme [Catenulispora pinisilvae]
MVVQTPSPAAYKISGRGASQIAASIEAGIAHGSLAPGQALPPIRDLAAELSVNPNTVSAAYRLLRDRGAVETAGRRGTRVRTQPATAPRNLSFQIPPGAKDLVTGDPNRRLLPELVFPSSVSQRLHKDESILPELLETARARLGADHVPTDDLLLTFGAGDAVDRALSAHLRPGDSVAVEDPGWGTVYRLLPAMNLTAVPVPIDAEGMTPEGLAAALKRGVRAVIITSRAQNPTGAAVSAARAKALRKVLAGHREVLLIEDDHGADLTRHHGLHTLAGSTELWAHIRSLSKAYGPDLRCAVVAADATTGGRMAGRLRLGAGWVSHLIQAQVQRLWTDETVEAQIIEAAGVYKERRDTLVAALAARGIEAFGTSGINVWIPVPEEAIVVSGLLAAGWAVAPGIWFRVDSPPGIRITIAYLDLADVEPLADAVAAVLSGTGPAGSV